MSDFRPQDQARLRRVFRFIDDEAPLSPGLDDLEAPSLTPNRSLRANSWWVAASVFVVTLLLAVPVALLLNSGRPAGPLSAPTPTTETTTTTTTTTLGVTPPERLPLDGRPGDLGVDSVSFLGVVFPASIEDIRMLAVWEAARSNVESGWVETCMDARGATIEIPRITAYQLRRSAAIPDFELDAEFGFHQPAPDDWSPTAPAGSTTDEATAWNLAYSECSNATEAKRSEEFDQVIGLALGTWFETVSVVTASPEMQPVTDQMLHCISEAGGPEVETVMELYSDRMGQYGEDSLDDVFAGALEKAKLIQQCAGDYDVIRKSLLVPERQGFMAEYADILDVAELYFNEVMKEAGIAVDE